MDLNSRSSSLFPRPVTIRPVVQWSGMPILLTDLPQQHDGVFKTLKKVLILLSGGIVGISKGNPLKTFPSPEIDQELVSVGTDEGRIQTFNELIQVVRTILLAKGTGQHGQGESRHSLPFLPHE